MNTSNDQQMKDSLSNNVNSSKTKFNFTNVTDRINTLHKQSSDSLTKKISSLRSPKGRKDIKERKNHIYL